MQVLKQVSPSLSAPTSANRKGDNHGFGLHASSALLDELVMRYKQLPTVPKGHRPSRGPALNTSSDAIQPPPMTSSAMTSSTVKGPSMITQLRLLTVRHWRIILREPRHVIVPLAQCLIFSVFLGLVCCYPLQANRNTKMHLYKTHPQTDIHMHTIRTRTRARAHVHKHEQAHTHSGSTRTRTRAHTHTHTHPRFFQLQHRPHCTVPSYFF